MKKIIYVIPILLIILGGYYYKINHREINPNSLKTIKVSYSPDEYAIRSIVDFAEGKEYFGKNGIKVQNIPNIKLVGASLKSGEVDATMNPVSSSLNEFLNDQDIKWVDKLTNYPPEISLYSFFKKEDLSQAKTTGVNRLGGTFQAYSELTRSNLNIGEVKYLVVPVGASQLATLEQKQTDYIIGNSYRTDMRDYAKSKGLVVIPSGELFKNKQNPLGIFTSSNTMRNKGTEMAAFVKSINQAKDYIKKHPKEYRDFLKQKYNLDDGLTDEIAAGMQNTLASDMPSQDDIKEVTDVVKKISESTSQKSLDDFISTQYIK